MSRWSNHKRIRERTDRYGYVLVHRPSHPRANLHGFVNRAWIVVEETLGRTLQPDEQVHHRNGVRSDDRPENLEVLTEEAHRRLHADLRRGRPRPAHWKLPGHPQKPLETRTCAVCGAPITRKRFDSPPARTTCSMPKPCRNQLIARTRKR